MDKKIVVLALVASFLMGLVINADYMAYHPVASNDLQKNPVACTQEAMQCPDGSYVSRTGPNCEFAQCPDAAVRTYSNTQQGVQFQYPDFTKLEPASPFFGPHDPEVIISSLQSTTIDSKGCFYDNSRYPAATNIPEQVITLGSTKFCFSEAGGAGAGSTYIDEFYTTLHENSHITLHYAFREVNGCPVFLGSPNYQPCLDYWNNRHPLIDSLIQDSVATLQFLK